MQLETLKWLFQRISTPLILILSLWLFYNAYQIKDYNYQTIKIFFNNYLNLIFFVTFVFLSLVHTSIEVFHSIHDYFAETTNEKIIKNTDTKDDHPVFGKVHLHPHSEFGKLPVIEVSIAYQKYPPLSIINGNSC